MQSVKMDIALIIVFLTGVAYATAYVFEFSYQNYFHLPVVFIDLNITTLTRSLLITLLAAGIILILSSFFTSLIIKTEASIKDIPVLILICYIAFLIVGALILGKFVASKKEEYMVLKQKEELFVVVTSYNGNLIIAPLDIKSETMTPEFQAIETKNMKDTQVISFKNGIKVKDLKSSKEFKEQLN